MKVEFHNGTPFAPDGRRVYPFVCPCGKTSYAAKSLSMEGGRNSGCGSCRCGRFLHLEMSSDGESMLAEEFQAWIDRTPV